MKSCNYLSALSNFNILLLMLQTLQRHFNSASPCWRGGVSFSIIDFKAFASRSETDCTYYSFHEPGDDLVLCGLMTLIRKEKNEPLNASPKFNKMTSFGPKLHFSISISTPWICFHCFKNKQSHSELNPPRNKNFFCSLVCKCTIIKSQTWHFVSKTTF